MLKLRLCLLVATLLAAAACGDSDGSTGGGDSPTTSSTTTVSSSSSSSSGTGGHGHMECTTADECTVTGTACTEKVCEEGMCGLAPLAAGTIVPDEDVPGDCQQAVCDAQGNVVTEDDDLDPPDDGLDCTVEGCAMGAPTSGLAPIDTPCTQDEGAFCDGEGACVDCNVSGQCMGGAICSNNACVPPSCMDGIWNGNETDEDCGGPDCNPCADTLMCVLDDDCVSDFCHPTNQVCTAPLCTDGFTNGGETDEDCGGPTCSTCDDGDTCAGDSDCTSDFCNLVNLLCAAPTCMDTFSNGDETGVDCGGPTCPACEINQGCLVDGDCLSGGCIAGQCAAINGCLLETAQDMTGQSAINISFSSFFYSPKCIRVSTGTNVTFQGSFGTHPLLGGYVSGGLNPASSGPFVPVTNSGTSKTVAMSTAGTFPYYCTAHALSGMTGVVFVVP